MQRRSFLKILGVGAAAPAVIPASSITPFNPSPLLGGMVASELTPEFDDGDNWGPIGKKRNPLKRLFKLRNLITGKEPYEEEEWSISRRRRIRAEVRINSIRSMSQTFKLHVLDREMYAIEKKATERGWIKEIFSLENPDDE